MDTKTIKKIKKVWNQGPINPEFIGESIAKHQSKTDIGAHEIFLGQIRADEYDGKTVRAVEYSAYEEMADPVFHDIRESTFDKFPITCMHIYHSLGSVKVGEISLFVFVSSPHRQTAREALAYVVEEVKAKAPVFGKELLSDGSYIVKENKA
ncbi:MAG TPA: molybdenum cofactor biosynthesis protein MoaE [Bacteroidetes bacterium]|nr:molybdenum cofactor biosynthesis protein MoaE [Bacteroidota bacterium]